MKKREFKKLLEEYTSNEIIEMYMTCKIYLTEKQLDKVCENSSHHGGCILGGRK